ncbi:pirin family protein [Shewanella benthica KT99]|uniref:Pirin family protein n=1 Tax=Shewanella benthica KT99 TaxID=314608 RepID=A9D0Q7_9GAMM|nr:pirin family protein [Shewanella benthica KT99]
MDEYRQRSHPFRDADEGLHGFQIWLNMPAKDKMRPARYQDTSETVNPEVSNNTGATLRALAGDWAFAGQAEISAPVQGLAGEAAIADLMLNPDAIAELQLKRHEFVGLYLYQGGYRAHGALCNEHTSGDPAGDR